MLYTYQLLNPSLAGMSTVFVQHKQRVSFGMLCSHRCPHYTAMDRLPSVIGGLEHALLSGGGNSLSSIHIWERLRAGGLNGLPRELENSTDS